MFNLKGPKDVFMAKGEESCKKSFDSIWLMATKFNQMIKQASEMGGKCLSAFLKARANGICAVCDHTNDKLFAKGVKFNTKDMEGVTQVCAPLLSYIKSAFDGFEKLQDMAKLVGYKDATNDFKELGATISTNLGKCFGAAPAKKDDAKK